MLSMSLYLDKKYATMLAGKLVFKQKGNYLWNMRCPFCGDSKKDKTKKRGFIYRKKDNLFYHCHNCHESMYFRNFLKRIDSEMYKTYTFEIFQENKKITTKSDDDFIVNPLSILKEDKSATKINLQSIMELSADHFARKEIRRRKIPERYWNEIYYTPCFKTFIDEIKPGNDKNIPLNERRIIFPFYDEKNIFLGVQGRALDASKVKYITILLSEGNTKLYGLNRVDLTKTIYVTEGPIDSLFLPNSLAVMDSQLYRVAEILGRRDYVFVYDNEKRNKQIVSNMQQTIKYGHKIFFWPKSIQEKDINDLILSGMSETEVLALVEKNTSSGMDAELRMSNWRK
jgi:transcription elongation factor Elf1